MTKSYIFPFIVMLGVTLLCSLGYWQLSRSFDKQALLSQAQEATRVEPFSSQVLLKQKPGTSLRFMPVALTTSFLNQKIILLDNQINNGRAGYHVIVPAILDNQNTILVNRGWIPIGKSRKIIPQPEPVKGEVTIEGYLDFAYRNSLISKAIENETITWPLRMQQLDKELIGKLIGKNIYPMVVNLNSDSPYAFVPPPKNAPWLSPQRHQGYAFQWFSLAATLLACYIFYQKKRKKP